MDTQWIYVTAPNRDQARRIGRALVEEKLAACINILGAIESIYRWEGQMESADEIGLIAKTAADRTEALIQRIVELHPYDCPCVVALPVREGYAPFQAWIVSETRDPGTGSTPGPSPGTA